MCVCGATDHVELSTAAAGSTVQRDELATEKVLSGRNALGDGDGLDTAVRDETVNAPFAV